MSDTKSGTGVAARVAGTRARKRAAGLVPKEVWIHPSRHDDLKKAEARLQKPAKVSETR